MAPPANTPLQAPTGFKMGDGYRTAISFSRLPSASFWEKTVKPVGVDGGGPVDTTTMRNNKWRTMQPKFLKTLSEVTVEVAWDPDAYNQIINNLINANAAISIWYPDRTSVDFYGILTKFEPGNHVEGEMPLAAMSIFPSNWDPVNFVEADPVVTPAAGT